MEKPMNIFKYGLVILAALTSGLYASDPADQVKQALANSAYKDFVTSKDSQPIIISNKLRKYIVHMASKVGPWSKETEEREGPDFGGYRVSISIKSGPDVAQWEGRHPKIEFRDGDFDGTPYWIDSGCGAYLNKVDATVHINWAYNGDEGKQRIIELLAIIKSALESQDIKPLR